MPCPIQNAAVRVIQHKFDLWKREQAAVLFGEKRAVVFVVESYKRNMKLCPDFAIWGPDRLNEHARPRANARKAVNPHVIFQFSWDNKFEKEKHAVDDMTMYAGVGKYEALGRPNVVYLIKAKQSIAEIQAFVSIRLCMDSTCTRPVRDSVLPIIRR
jgi:hypothetical protein